MLLNGHGGNIDPLHVALRRLDAMFPRAVLTRMECRTGEAK